MFSETLPSTDKDDVLVFTIASNETDGYKRFLRSVNVYGFRDNLRVLGLGEPWLGGDNIKTSAGGGYKVNLLKKALENYGNDDRKLLYLRTVTT